MVRARPDWVILPVADLDDIRQNTALRYTITGTPVDTAKVFMTGRSQAVRLPKAYRFNTSEVSIEKQADGAVVLRPKTQGRLGDRLWAILDGLPDDPTFVRPDQGAPEVRDWFDGPAPMPSRGVPRARRTTGGAKGRKSASKR